MGDRGGRHLLDSDASKRTGHVDLRMEPGSNVKWNKVSDSGPEFISAKERSLSPYSKRLALTKEMSRSPG